MTSRLNCNIAAFVIVATMCASVPCSAAPRRTAADIYRFDVAGVRLGMTSHEARTALRAAGFSVGDTEQSGSKTDTRGVVENVRFQCEVGSSSTNPIVYRVDYTIGYPNTSGADILLKHGPAFLDDVRKKYGVPDRVESQTISYGEIDRGINQGCKLQANTEMRIKLFDTALADRLIAEREKPARDAAEARLNDIKNLTKPSF